MGEPIAVERLISGGQTGVDEAALTAALQLGIPTGGWCPAGRQNEQGSIAEEFCLRETPLEDSSQRTEWNVRDSDSTLILCREVDLQGGTELTRKFADAWNRPCFMVSQGGENPVQKIREILSNCPHRILNLAGPRESEEPGIQDWAYEILLKALARGPSRSERS